MIDAIKELETMASLPSDWDGEGSEKPSPVAMASARRFLEAIGRLGEPMMSPCADGSVDAYWKTDDGMVLMNFSNGGKVGFFSDLAGVRMKGATVNG